MRSEFLLRARVFHRPGVLARLTGMFHRRAVQILSLAVSAGDAGEGDLVTIVVRTVGSEEDMMRLSLAVENLIDVHTVEVVPLRLGLGRELCRIQLRSPVRIASLRAAATAAGLDISSARCADAEGVLEVIGSPRALDGWLADLSSEEFVHASRSGIALDRASVGRAAFFDPGGPNS